MLRTRVCIYIKKKGKEDSFLFFLTVNYRSVIAVCACLSLSSIVECEDGLVDVYYTYTISVFYIYLSQSNNIV